VLAVTVIAVLVAAYIHGSLLDLRVYRSGGAAWLHGVPLYTGAFPSPLPFTYPPLSAEIFSVLAVVPLLVAVAILTVAGATALGATTALATRDPATPARIVAPVLAIAVAHGFEPTRMTLWYGQVNMVLMGLVALDCLLPRTRYPRGMLIGIAAAIKLTPAVFVLYFLARRQYKAAATAVISFAAATGLAFALAPRDSIDYWRSAIFDANRPGPAWFASNQSIRGALSRLELPTALTTGLWAVLVVGVLILAWIGAKRTKDPAVALLVVAAAGLLVSPVSWSHHWVWIVPAVAVWALRAYRHVVPMVLLVVTTVMFAIGPRYVPYGHDQEIDWTWWQHLIGDGYLIAALTFVVWSVVHRRTVAAGEPEPTLAATGS
jgi:alpha-1,2-mannosyltransferase